jgi:hypothetical protein
LGVAEGDWNGLGLSDVVVAVLSCFIKQLFLICIGLSYRMVILEEEEVSFKSVLQHWVDGTKKVHGKHQPGCSYCELK